MGNSDSLPFEGRTVLITGAGGGGATLRPREAASARRGTGQILSLEFARRGARVVAVDLNGESAQRTVELIEKESGTAVAIEASVAAPEDVEHVFSEAESHFGRVDIL